MIRTPQPRNDSLGSPTYVTTHRMHWNDSGENFPEERV